MSRLPTTDIRTVPPTNNVYTALAAAACVIVAAGLFVLLFIKGSSVGGLFQ